MKQIFVTIIAVVFSLGAFAQENLTGRVYHCASFAKAEINEAKSEMKKEMDKENLSAEEKREADQMTKAMFESIVTTMTVTFFSPKEMEIHMVAKFDEAKAKAGGLGWAIRKMMKLKIGKGKDSKIRGNYTFDGKTVRLIPKDTKKKSDKKERSFQMSTDGKFLLWNYEGKTVRMARTK